MDLFDDQIRQRKQNDQEVFENSILKMARVVTGGADYGTISDDRIITRGVIDEVLKYYHYKPAEIPESITEPEEQLAYACRPYGLMYRMVELVGDWYLDAYGPMILYRKTDGRPFTVYPRIGRGYWYQDEQGRMIRLNRSTASQFEREAICFYRALPQKALTIPDLILYLRQCISRYDIVILLVLMVLVTVAGMLLPRLTLFLTSFVLDQGESIVLWGTAVFLFASTFSMQMLAACRKLATERILNKTSNAVEAALMMRLMNLPPSFFKQFNAGELSSRSQSMKKLCQLIVSNVFSVGLTSVTSLIYLSQIFQLAPALAYPSVIIIVATVGLSLATTIMQMRITRMKMNLDAKGNGISYALIGGVQKIKLAGAEKRAFAKWADVYTKSAELAYDPPFFLKINSAIMTGVSLLGTIVLYSTAVRTGVTPSQYLAFNVAYGMVMGAFTTLSGIAQSIAQIEPIVEMAEPILKAEPESAEGKEIVTELSGGIELNHVCFRYEENLPYVIDGLNLKIRPGEYVAIVGRTGCGKSTLMRLLLGFEKPERGAIYYDGKDMNRMDLRSLRRKIGAVMQDGGLFQGDIYSNIVISQPTLTMEDAWEAASLAGIADDINKMPMGMSTIISEGQGGISGGQRQRIMIARAVAPKPRILIFDEATSALDNRAQKQVSEALDRLKCTRIVIAHRLSTIKNCNRILVLDQGRVIEDGTYEGLIEKGGFFAELVERQRVDFSGEQETAPDNGGNV
ncbi:MAG: ATP-binding cassette domain-containing protein [Lachnospiraceae bacterium]|nr:ATP-binding cassette domain-containing protein [Lachnospiraceae bacterium]